MTLRVVRCLAASALCAVVLAGSLAGAARGSDRRGSDIIRGEPVDRTSIDLTATYRVDATLSWADATIEARTVLDVTNTSGGPIDRVELNTVAGPLGDMEILKAQVDKQPVSVTVDEQTIVVPLGGNLPKGAGTTVLIRYRATFGEDTGGLTEIFAKSDGMIAAYRWIPWISRKREWRSVAVGDPYFTALSPRVEVTLTTDRPLVVVTSAKRLATEALTQSYVARNVRDFNFTAAPDYQVLRGRSIDGDTRFMVYSRTASAGRRQQIMDWARRAFHAFEGRVGQYPYPRYVISEAPGNSGLESPGLTWIGRHAISGGNASFLTVHETGHQWFYAVVGNDQPREPFADEGVVEFLTRWHQGTFRASQCAKDRLDGSTFAYGDCFYEVVYVQGASFLNGIRGDIGSNRFWAALRGYWQAHKFEFGGTFELLEALRVAAKDAGVNLRPRLHDRFPSLY
jgi:aminopeptidase N